jgi:hypothetical protein
MRADTLIENTILAMATSNKILIRVYAVTCRVGVAQAAGPLFGYGDRDHLDATADVSSPDRGLRGIHFRLSGRDRFCSRPQHFEPARHDVTVSLPRVDAGWAPAVLIDSRGLKVYGAGEWLREKHGAHAEAGANCISPLTLPAA